ncbi:hypothetical protein SBRCBS47491_006708 [Sporothrix bragantina]|uniref:Uncharacterized protein n=1 Tax=Sporothrix bragantina TaxID=671064 RepID=A0ABP0C9A9_9PEZI
MATQVKDDEHQQYDDGPEVALQPYPEVIPPPPSQTPSHAYSLSATQPPSSTGGYPSPSYSPSKPEDGGYVVPAVSVAEAGAGPGAALGPQYPQYHPHYYNPLSSRDMGGVAESGNGDGAAHGGDRGRHGAWAQSQGPCGCTLLVFVLSTIIAVLAAMVVGLAAGTGVEAHRASQALASLAELQANPPAPSASATANAAPSFASIDNNCSIQPDTVTGTMYTSFKLLGQQTFTIHCNMDTQGAPLMSLFTPDFDTCMDTCSGYSKGLHKTFNVTNTNTTCGGVSFVPLWTNKANATAGKAPGNCYIKPSPLTTSNLTTVTISTEVHAAILS